MKSSEHVAKGEKAYPVKIGLEIHGYLDTNEKLFCECKTNANLKDEDEDLPNSRICPICTGTPGCKPMLPNKQAVMNVVKISLIMGCKINSDKELIWQRKHYDWADLPKGYQNTVSGAYSIPCSENGKFQGIKIRECHIEEDPAQWNPETGRVNYNRSGLPLIEIVTEPEFSNSEQVIDWLKKLIHSLSYVKAINKNSGIKVDVNVSTYGERVEIKNLNSLESIENAIDYEIKRQVENHNNGISQNRETLAFDPVSGTTIKMREKESGEDYRFIPEPDLPFLVIDEKDVKAVEKEIPEMPEIKLEKLLKKYKLEKSDAEILAKNIELVDFFETLSKEVDAKKYVSWVTVELLRVLNYNKKTLEDEDVDILPKHLAELIKEVDKGNITILKAKQIMNDFIPHSFSVKEKFGSSSKEISKVKFSDVERFCKKVIEKNKAAVEDYKRGKQQALNFLVGEVMKVSERRADFKTAKDCLIKLLK